jgi:hypothetical protein
MKRRSPMSTGVLLLTAGLLQSACGGSEPPEPSPPPPPVSETVFGDAVGTMDRARAVEDVTMQQKQAIDQALEQAEGNGGTAGSP